MLQNRSVWMTALIAGALMGVLSSIPGVSLVNCLLCGWLWLGGIFAVWYYKRSYAGIVTPGDGALLGAAAGLIGAVVGTILGAVIGASATMAQLTQAGEMLGETGDAVIALMAGGVGTVIMFFFNLVFYVGFGALGGLIGASMFGRRTGQPGM